ncbi:DNA-directed RNA polymerase subunit beta', partial [Candidatus Uhrbacteria bacterium]|nr:DNA-directed RNA polymerase subunit beta' [Candidatus Uhrbacteria bacterium]
MNTFETATFDFSAMRLKIASPDVMRKWSHGEVTKPETINYRTQKPEKDGLFSERIFGPSKDWECYCGKYKKIRYKGIVCDKCGVEVTRSIVRRERMGHIELCAPVSHIWFLRGVPSKIGIVLDLSVQNLEKVIYFANFIILRVDDALRTAALEQLQDEARAKRKQIEHEHERQVQEVQSKSVAEEAKNKALLRAHEQKEEQIQELDDAVRLAETELKGLTPMQIISETDYRDLSLKYGHVFEAGIGAEAIYTLLQNIDCAKLIRTLEEELEEGASARKDRLLRRIKLLKSLVKNKTRTEWMVLTTIPIIPPDLRPMVPLDGGRFATSDLNDLYRRVINRNNRFRQLIELNAPEVITRNEKRMLQEAVDSLIDNAARHGKTVTASTGQKRQLKSIADMLKGKQGRFRQNLLGKRTDYSGRSVIVVGPHLELHQCGLPKRMALELFKPFIIAKLIAREIVYNVRSASRFIETGAPVVWDILEEITKDAYVLLNRAPTLHRLGIQAFQPLLIEGKAIQIHPLVCTAFNADFDGDQMAVHVPLTDEAKREARDIMLSRKNLLKPATGDPVVTPSQDIVWGGFYLTTSKEKVADAVLVRFGSPEEAILAYQMKRIGLQDPVLVRFTEKRGEREMPPLEKGFLETTVGRILLNAIMPVEIPYKNEVMDKKKLGAVVRLSIELCGQDRTASFLDAMKELAFEYLTKSGMSWGMDDIPVIAEKGNMIADADKQVNEVQEQYASGLLTESERYTKIIEIWTAVKDIIVRLSKESLDRKGSIFSMIESGARGSWGQLT